MKSWLKNAWKKLRRLTKLRVNVWFDDSSNLEDSEIPLSRYIDDGSLHPEEWHPRIIEIRVADEATKAELLVASRYLHDLNVDTDYKMINTLVHLHQCPSLVVVDGAIKKPTVLDPKDASAAPKVVAWAWTSDGMKGWALGHLRPTPENTHKFHERNTIVRALVFQEDAITIAFSNPRKGGEYLESLYRAGARERYQADRIDWIQPETWKDPAI